MVLRVYWFCNQLAYLVTMNILGWILKRDKQYNKKNSFNAGQTEKAKNLHVSNTAEYKAAEAVDGDMSEPHFCLSDVETNL